MKNYIKNYFKKKREAKEEVRKKEEFRLRIKYGPRYKDYILGKAIAESFLGH